MKIAVVIGIFIILFISMYLVVKYCKSKAKVILLLILSIITIYFVAFTIDAHRVINFKSPIFAWDIKSNRANEKQYKGLGYKINIYYFENGDTEKTEMSVFGKVIARSITNTNSDDFTIVDETQVCAQALELMHEDDEYKYYFECIKSETVFIVFADGSRLSVRDAMLVSSKNWIVLIIEKYPELFYKEAK
jgi:hypothetical protein